MENLKKHGSRLLAVVFTVCAFLIFGFAAVIIPSTSTAFYKSQFRKNDTLKYVQYQSRYLEGDAKEYIANLTEEQLLSLMRHTMRYCLYFEDDLNPTVNGEKLQVFRNESGETLTDGCREISHMADVKRVFGGGMILVGVAFALFVAILVLGLVYKSAYYKFCRKTPYITIIAVVALLAVVGIAAAVNFDYAFALFHKIFFDGTQWQFSNGVMIAMIGDIFTGIVPVIIGIWGGLCALFVSVIALVNKKLSKKFY